MNTSYRTNINLHPLQIPFVVYDNSIPALRATVNRTLVIAPPCDYGQYTCTDTDASGTKAVSCSPVQCNLRCACLRLTHDMQPQVHSWLRQPRCSHCWLE